MVRFRLSLFAILFNIYTLNVYSAFSQSQEKPNIIIMIGDDISWNDFGAYGHPVIRTPNIDLLAENGIRFNRAYLTASSCSPSRASIITGRYPHNTGGPELHTDLAENQIAFPKLLKEAGYYTAQAGKWHFGSSGDKAAGVVAPAFDRTGGHKKDGGGESGSEKWVEYIKERPADKPFFMWFAAHDAHREWDNDIFLKSYQLSEVIVPPYFVDNEATRKDLIAYYDEVERFDFYVGKVVEELKRQKIFDNTILIIMADNGRPFPRDKSLLYESAIKTPFIIHWPLGITKPGSVSESLLSAIDIAPTLTEIAIGGSSPTFQGKSFSKILKNPDLPFRKYAFAEHNWHDYQAYERMVTDGKFMYVYNGLPYLDKQGAIDIICSGTGLSLKHSKLENKLPEAAFLILSTAQPQYEFYDLNNDPLQMTNLFNLKEYKKNQKKLAKALSQWQYQTEDSQPKELTPDWYSRVDCTPLPEHGKRGILPGSDKNAHLVKKSGPF
jgi:N-sulfoglucosamine sulfohydrolase